MRNGIGLAVMAICLAMPLLGQAQDSGPLFASLRGQGKLPVVGLAWEGAPAPLASVADFPKRPKGDSSVSLAMQGGKKACQRLEQAKSEGKALPRLRLRDEGKTMGMVLRNASIVGVDCAANPWTVELDAETIKAKRRK